MLVLANKVLLEFGRSHLCQDCQGCFQDTVPKVAAAEIV